MYGIKGKDLPTRWYMTDRAAQETIRTIWPAEGGEEEGGEGGEMES